MSIETWKQEFYPVSAKEVEKEKAAEHSFRKWEGARKENLEKHGLERATTTTSSIRCVGDHLGDRFYFDGVSCSLCVHFYKQGDGWDDGCENCPLCIVRGGVPCTGTAEGERVSPYDKFVSTSNPEPMISALKLAVEWQEKQRKESRENG